MRRQLLQAANLEQQSSKWGLLLFIGIWYYLRGSVLLLDGPAAAFVVAAFALERSGRTAAAGGGAGGGGTGKKTHDNNHEWKFSIEETIIPSPATSNLPTTTTLLEHLMSCQAFPTRSQARRAIKHGEILVLSKQDTFNPQLPYNNANANNQRIMIIEPSMIITPNHDYRIHRITRLPTNHCYPIEVTKFVFPPTILQSLFFVNDGRWCRDDLVVYENNEIAILCKPEGMTTIDTETSTKKEQRQDLQSLLPFVLSPPSSPTKTTTTTTTTTRGKQKLPQPTMILPRPVHRLDRGTSGLVIVAKTKSSLQHFSALFAQRQIQKTYTAIVFKKPKTTSAAAGGMIINYPIDGKEAVTEWELLETNGEFSKLKLYPHTGRFHQLRRHLAYCLQTPIVGDTKYDIVGITSTATGTATEDDDDDDDKKKAFRRSFRNQGLHLCCNQLEFDYYYNNDDESDDNNCQQTSSSDSFSIVYRGHESNNHNDDNHNDLGTRRMVISMKLPRKMEVLPPI